MPIILAASVAVCLSTPMRWERPGTSEAASDEAECRAQARQQAIDELRDGNGPPLYGYTSVVSMLQWKMAIDNDRTYLADALIPCPPRTRRPGQSIDAHATFEVISHAIEEAEQAGLVSVKRRTGMRPSTHAPTWLPWVPAPREAKALHGLCSDCQREVTTMTSEGKSLGASEGKSQGLGNFRREAPPWTSSYQGRAISIGLGSAGHPAGRARPARARRDQPAIR